MAKLKPIVAPLAQLETTDTLDAKAYVSANNVLLGRITAGDGGHEEMTISGLAENEAPAAGDWLLYESAAGDLGKIDVGNLISAAPQINEYDTDGSHTWNKPTGAKSIYVIVIGAGGGGGSGYIRDLNAETNNRGGQGGGAGGRSEKMFAADEISASVTVTVGASGTGGIGVTGLTVAGNNGAAGGASSFGNILKAAGGSGGAGGGASTPPALAPGPGMMSVGGIPLSHSSANGQAADRPNYASYSGGNGGGFISEPWPETRSGGNGRSTQYPIFSSDSNIGTGFGGAGGIADGANGTDGQTFGNYMSVGGGGGSSGYEPYSGGNGGPYGAGGGGGGAVAAETSGTSGAGGNGGDGAVIVITYF